MRRAHIPALAAVAVATLAGCGSSSPNATIQRVRNARLGVLIAGRKLPAKLEVTTALPPRARYRGATRISRTFRIEPSGALPTTATIRIPLVRLVPAGDVVLVATSESRTGPRTMLRAQILAGRKAVIVHVGHLSFFTAFLVDVKSIFSTIKQTILDGLTSDVAAEASPPTCSDEAGARQDGYSIASDSKNTIYWCFGIENGRRILRVVNNRRYPLEVSHPGLSVVNAGPISLSLSGLSRAVSGADTIIFPRDTVVFGADLSPGTRAGLQTQLDGLGQSLYQLEEGLSAAAFFLTAGESKYPKIALTTTENLLTHASDTSECLSALGETGGDLLAKCVSSVLQDVYGPKGEVAAAAIEAGSLLAFFRSESNALFDQINHRDSYRVVISRSGTAPPPPTTTQEVVTPTTTNSGVQPTQSLAIGSSFSDECVVAWPTAPVITSQDIQMTMSCAHVPENEYLFTNVTYGDPHLDITPDTGQVRVVGKVVDVATSAYGFKELVVEASSVQLP